MRMKFKRLERTLFIPGLGDLAVGVFVDSEDTLIGTTSRLIE